MKHVIKFEKEAKDVPSYVSLQHYLPAVLWKIAVYNFGCW